MSDDVEEPGSLSASARKQALGKGEQLSHTHGTGWPTLASGLWGTTAPPRLSVHLTPCDPHPGQMTDVQRAQDWGLRRLPLLRALPCQARSLSTCQPHRPHRQAEPRGARSQGAAPNRTDFQLQEPTPSSGQPKPLSLRPQVIKKVGSPQELRL